MLEKTPVQVFHLEEKRRRFRRGGFFLKLAVLLLFLLVPVAFPSFKTVDLAMKIALFAVLVAGFDIMLGYTGILSFGHGMFFGIGAYCMGMFLGKYGAPTYANMVLAFLAAVIVASLLALLISFLSLRVKAIFFAMITLAIAELAIVLATKLSGITGGEDGITFQLPGIFATSFRMIGPLNVELTGKTISYYFILIVCLCLFLAMLRFIHSPMGRVLQAIRDNEQRAEALGYRTFVFQTTSIVFGCVTAGIVGCLYAVWVKYVNPESSLGVMTIMLDVLLMVIIGGMGTLYGGIVGAAFLKVAQTFLPDLQTLAKDVFPHATLLHNAVERWLLIFGVLFILVVVFFPKGVLGSVQEYIGRRKG